MDYTDQEMISHDHEVDSPLPPNDAAEERESKQAPSIGRQSSSVYSLTLDEFQSTMCENGKNFGSMNMDEFLNNIWSAEEQQAQTTTAMPVTSTTTTTNHLSCSPLLQNTRGYPADVDHKGILKQHSLPRQGSITIPAPLSQKTVDEVWAEIHTGRHDPQHNTPRQDTPEGDSTQQQRQLTFGEMTLEDFLVRAGVVREQPQPTPPVVTYASPSLYPNTNPALMGTTTFVPTMPAAIPMGTSLGVNIAPYQPLLQPRPIVGEIPSPHPGALKRGTAGGYSLEAAPVSYGGRIGNGNESVGYSQVTPLAAVASPVSPASPDGMMTNQGEGTSYDGMDMSVYRGGRKRNMDGPIEKVVERRQRRMIKNRESAARSRARKQAYTVELEAELNLLKEDNAHLNQIIKDLERKRIAQDHQLEEMRLRAETSRPQRVGERLRMLRRTASCP